MELNNEIKKLFDKFEGGYCSYESLDGKLRMYADTNHYITDIGIYIPEDDTSVSFEKVHDDEFNIGYSFNGKRIEGHYTMVSDEVYNYTVKAILKSMQYFENNGFNIEKYNEKTLNEYNKIKSDFEESKCLNRKDKYRVALSNKFEAMERIINEEPKLFWK